MKKVFYPHLIYKIYLLIATAIFFILPIVLVVLVIVDLFGDNPTASNNVLIGFIALMVFSILLYLYIVASFTQKVIVKNDQIIARNIYGIIKEVGVEDIKQVFVTDLDFSLPGTSHKWIILIEKNEIMKFGNGIIRKDTHITIKFTEENLTFINNLFREALERRVID